VHKFLATREADLDAAKAKAQAEAEAKKSWKPIGKDVVAVNISHRQRALAKLYKVEMKAKNESAQAHYFNKTCLQGSLEQAYNVTYFDYTTGRALDIDSHVPKFTLAHLQRTCCCGTWPCSQGRHRP
jgi:hypothetical protein